MLIHHLVGGALRVAVLLALALLAMPLLRRASSATRRLVLALSLGGALALPLVSVAVPSWHVQAPAAVGSLRGIVVAEAPVPRGPSAEIAPQREVASVPTRVEAPRTFRASALLAVVWAAGAALVLARLLVGMVRARRIVGR
ncbi:MAG: hypothetical protein ACRELB_11330, partial [Polyangiaceae bacterium]